MLSFEDVIKENKKLILSPGTENEVVGFYTREHIHEHTVPDNWFIYKLRHNGKGRFIFLEKNVVINYAGTFLTERPVKIPDKGYCRLDDYKFI